MPGDESMQSIQRMVKILYEVAGAENGRTVHQIANAVGLKPNTVYKFTRTLEREHLILRKAKPLRFFLGDAITELETLNAKRHLLTVSGKILVQAQALLPQSTMILLELHDTTTYKRLYVGSARPGVLIRCRAFKVPCYEKASSLLFLAYSHPEDARRLYDAHPMETEGSRWKSHDELEDFLTKTRRLGVSIPNFTDADGDLFRVAVPVFSKGNEVVAAVGGHVYNDEPKRVRTELVQLCKKTAAKIMASL